MASIRTSRWALAAAVWLVLALAGCEGFRTRGDEINDTMKSWVGCHESALIRSWGPPNRTTRDGKGGSVLVYEYVREGYGYEPDAYSYRDAYGNDRYRYTATRSFYVGRDGIIYAWRWKGH